MPLLKEWKAYSRKSTRLIHIVTRAKRNCTAYERPGAYKGRGRRPVHGTAVHLRELFISDAALFQEAYLQMYGTEKKVRFLFRTYLWGQKLYQPLRFVLVEYEKTQAILVCTDLSMRAEDIITAYAHRFKIEAMFREMKQCFGWFCYHFWSKAVPKLDRYRRKTASDPLELVKDEQERTKILKTPRAVEGCVLFSSTAMGITQMLCLKYEGKIQVSDFRYLRTSSRKVMSEASVMEYLRRNLFRFMALQEELTITKIISSRQDPFETEEIDLLIS